MDAMVWGNILDADMTFVEAIWVTKKPLPAPDNVKAVQKLDGSKNQTRFHVVDANWW